MEIQRRQIKIDLCYSRKFAENSLIGLKIVEWFITCNDKLKNKKKYHFLIIKRITIRQMQRNIIQVTEDEFHKLFTIKGSQIDSGTYGDVSRATRTEDNQDVAIKYLKENIYLKTLEAEASIMSKVFH